MQAAKNLIAIGDFNLDEDSRHSNDYHIFKWRWNLSGKFHLTKSVHLAYVSVTIKFSNLVNSTNLDFFYL